jgi:hypothetical protein
MSFGELPRAVETPQPDPVFRTDEEKARIALEFREAARARLIPFCQYMWPGFVARPHRQLIASALEMCEARRIKRLMIFCPPQYGKSELVSRSFPAWYLGRNPTHKIILASYGESLAFNLSTDARNKVQDPAFATIFGEKSSYKKPVKISRNSKSVKEWRLEGFPGRMKSAGVGGGITGHPADLIIIDDPVKDAKQADSEVSREALIAWFKTSVITRLDPNGILILCMTRWNEADLAGWLLQRQREGGEQYYVLRLPARAESPEEIKNWCKRNHVKADHHLVADRILDLAA